MIYKSAFQRLKGVKSITFYAVPLLNKSQTTINGKQMLVFKSDDILIEKLDPVDIIYYTSVGISLDVIQIDWDDTVILDAVNDINLKFEIQKYYVNNVFTQLTKIELPQSDIILNSASLLLLSAGLIYSIVLYQHLEEAESKKVLALNKDVVKVDVPKPSAKSKDLLESKPIIPFEAYKTIDYHSYTK